MLGKSQKVFDLGRSFLASVNRLPSAIAISDGKIRRTYNQWQKDVLSIVSGLDSLNLRIGDHVVTMLTNRYEAASLHIACQISGIAVTPVNWRVQPNELDYVLKDCSAKAIVFEKLSENTIIASSTSREIRRIGIGSLDEGNIPWKILMDNKPASEETRSTTQTISVMLYTSGTTGRGKGVPRTHLAERTSAIAHVTQNLYERGEVTLGVMPLYHTMGIRSLLSSILINGHFVCQSRFNPTEALHLIEKERITNLYLVPTLYHDLLIAPTFSNADVSSVKKLGFAGQTMTDGLLNRLNAAFKPQLFVNHYGSSEIYTFTYEPNAVKKPGSAGKAGLNQEIRIITLGSNNINDVVSPNIEGQIIATMHGDEAFEGYWNQPDADAKSLQDSWYLTGDIGYWDNDGDLFVTGRVDDMIISGGENILPAEVESKLSLHPSVGEVAVVGLPDKRLGHQVTAFLTRVDNVRADDLDKWCLNSDMPSFKRPRAYVFVKAIPKSPVGKILRRLLVSGEYQPE